MRIGASLAAAAVATAMLFGATASASAADGSTERSCRIATGTPDCMDASPRVTLVADEAGTNTFGDSRDYMAVLGLGGSLLVDMSAGSPDLVVAGSGRPEVETTGSIRKN